MNIEKSGRSILNETCYPICSQRHDTIFNSFNQADKEHKEYSHFVTKLLVTTTLT